MAGLLDGLFSGNGIGGGLLDYLNSPLYQSASPSQFQQPDMSMTPTERQMMAMVRPDVLPSFPNAMPPGGMPQQAPQQSGPPQASPIAIGSYMMPRIGPASAYQSDPAAIPPNAQPTQGQAPQGQVPQMPDQAMPLPPALGGNNFGGNFGAGLQSFANTPGGLIPKLLGGITAGTTGQRTDPIGLQQQNLKAQYDSLVPVLGPKNALLAIMNPEAGKTLIQEALTNKEKYGVVSENPIEGKKYGFINEREQTVNGKPIGAGGSSSASPGGMLATGVQGYNPNLTGDDYLNQFSPEVKASVRAYMNGDVMPSGNQRMQSIASFAKTVAQKYGQDMGIPVSDNTYTEKRKLRTDLASSGNSSMGGILSNGESSFAHLAELGKSMSDLGNASHDFPGGGLVASAQNALGNDYLAGSKRKGEVAATQNNLTRYGQESTKFYAGSGGGVEERTAALKLMDPKTKSSEEMAAYLEKEKSLMLDRLNGKLAQIKQVLGEEEGNREIAKHLPSIEKNVATLDASIKNLRGEAAEAPAASGSNGLPSGWTVKVH